MFPLESVVCLDPEQQDRWAEEFHHHSIFSNLTASALQEASWRPLHAPVTTCVLLEKSHHVVDLPHVDTLQRQSVPALLWDPATLQNQRKGRKRWGFKLPLKQWTVNRAWAGTAVLHCWSCWKVAGSWGLFLPVPPPRTDTDHSTASPWSACL